MIRTDKQGDLLQRFPCFILELYVKRKGFFYDLLLEAGGDDPREARGVRSGFSLHILFI